MSSLNMSLSVGVGCFLAGAVTQFLVGKYLNSSKDSSSTEIESKKTCLDDASPKAITLNHYVTTVPVIFGCLASSGLVGLLNPDTMLILKMRGRVQQLRLASEDEVQTVPKALTAPIEVQVALAALAELQDDYVKLDTHHQKTQAAYEALSEQHAELGDQLRAAEETAEQVGPLEQYNNELKDGIRVALVVLEKKVAVEAQLREVQQALAMLQAQNQDVQAKLEAATRDGKVAKLAVYDLQLKLVAKDKELSRAHKAAAAADAETQKTKQSENRSLWELQNTKDALFEAQRDVEYMDGERSRAAKANAKTQIALRTLQSQLREKKEGFSLEPVHSPAVVADE
ncbi:MAG TPA: hypothetical protein VIJ14_08350 [Rhabdochlamydiaceae bacterium]